MRCDECRAAILAGEMDDRARQHLLGCVDCQSEQPALEAGRELLADQALWEEPPADLGDRIVESLAPRRSKPPATRNTSRWVRVSAIAAAFMVAIGSFALFRQAQPDWEVPLPGTELAPIAMGTVRGWNTDSGTRMVLEVDGLEAAPDGFFYEFWLSEGPVHISAGTFSAAERVELWTAVKRADFPRLWVTLEPIDDDESPTRHTVLDTGSA